MTRRAEIGEAGRRFMGWKKLRATIQAQAEEIEEQARVNGKGGEREAALLAGVDVLEKRDLSRAREALETISGYKARSQYPGCCPYGCDAPSIADTALAALAYLSATEGK